MLLLVWTHWLLQFPGNTELAERFDVLFWVASHTLGLLVISETYFILAESYIYSWLLSFSRNNTENKCLPIFLELDLLNIMIYMFLVQGKIHIK